MGPQLPLSGRSRCEEAFKRFDRANAEDPDRLIVDGVSQPKALVYAIRMTDRLERFAPEASEPLRLAARCQHIRRWTIPRADFASGRTGYRLWRQTLGVLHADIAAEILRAISYDEATITRVGALLRKDNLKSDQDTQTLEDVACLVFLKHYLADFASDRDEAMLIEILRKSWRKMSDTGRAAALDLNLAPEVQTLVTRAVG
jgi:hypothetical protein